MKSIELSWKTTSDNCKDVLHTLRNLSYNCSCSSNEKTGKSNNNNLNSLKFYNYFRLKFICFVFLVCLFFKNINLIDNLHIQNIYFVLKVTTWQYNIDLIFVHNYN